MFDQKEARSLYARPLYKFSRRHRQVRLEPASKGSRGHVRGVSQGFPCPGSSRIIDDILNQTRQSLILSELGREIGCILALPARAAKLNHELAGDVER